MELGRVDKMQPFSLTNIWPALVGFMLDTEDTSLSFFLKVASLM